MKNFKIAILLFVVLTVLTGIIYPLLITVAGQLLFPYQANGSFVKNKAGKIIGSELIGQKFQNPKYFLARPSAIDYNPMPSGGSNLAIGSKALQKNIQDCKTQFLKQNPTVKKVPDDLLFASGSGLDPHISIAAANAQVDRIVKIRKWSAAKKQAVKNIINKLTEQRSWIILGEPRINVLKLNLALDMM